MYFASMTTIRLADTNDIESIQNIAENTWMSTYIPIIGLKQVLYMLDLFYGTEKLNQQIGGNEHTFLLLLENDQPVGFAAFSPRPENAEIYKLHKLYCLDETRGKGYGRMLTDAVIDAVKNAGHHILELNVNRHNPAVGFYKKNGFVIAYEEDIDIGNGYQMNDYVMRMEF